jgi:hypothetical protein
VELLAPGCVDHRWLCWHLGNGQFLRVNSWDNGERSYLMGSRKAIQDDFFAAFSPGDIEIDEADNQANRLWRMGLRRISKALSCPETSNKP